MKSLLVAASKAERKVLNTRNLISNQTTALMVATVPGYIATSATMGTVTPGLPSVAERTISGNTHIPDSEWTTGDCVACGSSTHCYMKPRSTVCLGSTNLLTLGWLFYPRNVPRPTI